MLKNEWRYLTLAIGFFTRIPMPSVPDFQASDLNHASKYFTLAGVLVGAVGALTYWVTAQVLPQSIAILLSMMATLYTTGCFHEDGLADAVDGLGGGWEREQVLTIMQDSRIGSYGAIALVMALLCKYELLQSLAHAPLVWIIIAAHAWSRYMALWVIRTQVYARPSGKAKPLSTALSNQDLCIASLFAVMPLLLLPWQYLGTLLPVGLVWWWFSRLMHRRIGGYTGDCLGAMQQLTELTFYLGIVILLPYL